MEAATSTSSAPPDTIAVLDHGFVRLDAAMADDLSVANSARVSFGKRVEELGDSDVGLIRFLMRERHGTPFEHNSFRFHIRCPIFVVREWMRHRISSFNEESARYHEMEDLFYVPRINDVRQQVGKPGSYTFEPLPEDVAAEVPGKIRSACEQSYATYRELLASGVAKELARSVLPVGLYTQFYWTLNARALMNFLSLRNAETAQREIRHYAEAVEEFFAREMPVTHAAFVAHDRTAP